jgi:hypothetical protein
VNYVKYESEQSHLWLFVFARGYPAVTEHKNGLGPDADVIALDNGISSFLKTRLTGVIVSAVALTIMPPSSSSDQSEYDLGAFSSNNAPGEFGPLDCISWMLGSLALGNLSHNLGYRGISKERWSM